MKLLLLPIIVVLVLGLTITAYSEEIVEELIEPHIVNDDIRPEQNNIPENTEPNIPDWIRTVAGLWASGIITDEQYTNSLEYMIDNGLVNVNLITTATAPTTTLTGTNPPDWIKTLAGLWASELTTDQEYLNAIKYLINNELITVTITSVIKGTVTDSNGIGISGAIVFFGTENTFTNSDGTYEISGLNAGTYTVTVIPPIGLTETRQVTLTVGNNTVDFMLGIIPSVMGTVTDTDGNGVAGVTVNILGVSESTVTSEDGNYSFENVGEGTRTVFITPLSGYELVDVYIITVKVKEGESAVADFTLRSTMSTTPPVTVTPTTSPPNAPTNLKGVSEDNSLKLTWDAPRNTGSSAIIDYKIEWKRNTSTVWNTLNDSQSTRTNSTITGLTDGIQYNFRVSAVNSSGESIPSNVITITHKGVEKIVIDSCGHDSLWGVVKVIGRYTADADYTRVYLDHVVLDKNGNVLDVHPYDPIQNISKGETRSFEIFSRHSGEFGSCKVEINSEYRPR